MNDTPLNQSISPPRAIAALSPVATKELQTLLDNLGYSVGPIDGIPGRQTESAWAAFKRDRWLNQPNSIGLSSYHALIKSIPKALKRRQVSDKGVALIKAFEGLMLTPYLCAGSVLTIGYGHTRNVKKGDRINEAQAEELLRQDLKTFEDAIAELVKVPLEPHQFDALASFAFNVGTNALRSSTLLKMLNARNYRGAADQFLRWDKAGGRSLEGLRRRREAERKMFLGG